MTSNISVNEATQNQEANSLNDIIGKLEEASDAREITDVLRQMLNSDLSSIEQDRLLKLIKMRTGITLGALRDQMRNLSIAGSRDLGTYFAHRVLALHYADGAHLLRSPEGSFWHYTGTHWQRISDERLGHLVFNVIQELESVIDKDSISDLIQDTIDILRHLQAKSDDPLGFSQPPRSVINCRNGELWIKYDGSVKFQDHDPNSCLTYVLDVDYDPEATCPRFDETVLDLFRDSSEPEEMRRHLYEIIGFIIQPRRFIDCWFMFLGNGANGKTSIAETMKRLMCDDAIHAERLAALSSSRFKMGALRGKLLFVDDDLDTGTRIPEGVLKSFTGNKRVTGERKFKDEFEYTSCIAVLLLANNTPGTADLTYGTRRRANIVPFNRELTPEERDPALFATIWQNEMSGILNRALEGLQRVMERGDFAPPEDCQEALENWLREANPTKAFVDEQCQVEAGAAISLKELHNNMRLWLSDNGYSYQLSLQQLRSNLEALGFRTSRSSGRQRVFDLKLRQDCHIPAYPVYRNFNQDK